MVSSQLSRSRIVSSLNQRRMQTEQRLGWRLHALGRSRRHLRPTLDERRRIAKRAAAQRSSLQLAYILAGRRDVAQLSADFAPRLAQQHEIAIVSLDLVEQAARAPVSPADAPHLPQRLPQ